MVLMNPPTLSQTELKEIDRESDILIKSIPKNKFSPKKAIRILTAASHKIAKQTNTPLNERALGNPPPVSISYDLAKVAPVAVTNAALVTALSSWFETYIKPSFVSTTKPEVYAKLSGAGFGAAVTVAEWGACKLLEKKDKLDTYWSTSVLVGGVVALGIRLFTAFMPEYFANPALPVTTTTNTTTVTQQAKTGDFLNVNHVPRTLTNRAVTNRMLTSRTLAKPVTKPTRALADFMNVPQVQAATQQAVIVSPFRGMPIVRS